MRSDWIRKRTAKGILTFLEVTKKAGMTFVGRDCKGLNILKKASTVCLEEGVVCERCGCSGR